MTISLRNRMVLTYSLFVCVFILLLSFVINQFALWLFQGFVRDSADEQSRQAAVLVSEQYSPETGRFDLAALRAIAMNHARQGFFLTIEDVEGIVLVGELAELIFAPWELDDGFDGTPPWAREQESGGSPPWAQSRQMNLRVQSRHSAAGDYDGLRRQVFPIAYNTQNIGQVIVETRAHYLFNENQFAFVTSLNRFLLWIGMVFGLLSVVITAFLAGTLSKPILKAANTAIRIADGDWSTRIPEEHRTREIGELSRSLNHLAAALEDGDRQQKQLTTDVAHELRTPLATLQGNMEAMIDGVWEPSPERIASCHEEIVRLSKLVEDLGRLSILERKGIILSRTEFDLRALLAVVVNQAEPAAMKKGISVSLEAENSPILADYDRLKQVFVNILSNAVKYTDKGSVTVAVKYIAAEYAVLVSDTGNGIPSGDLPYVFQRFFRSDKSRNRATGGAGIGLTIAQTIVSAHGGRIEVSSEIGHGSIFSIFLPKNILSS